MPLTESPTPVRRRRRREDSASPRLLMTGAAARFLGVPRQMLDHLALCGEIPHYLLGGNRYKWFRPEDLTAYLEANRRVDRPKL